MNIDLKQVCISFLFLLLISTGCQQQKTYEFDLIISDGNVIDGSGSLWFPADVAIKGKEIVEVGRIPNKEQRSPQIINAKGLIVAPGFIDIHSHSNFSLLIDGSAKSKIFQGITTEILGESKLSSPTEEKTKIFLEKFSLKPDWKTLRDYFVLLKTRGVSVNVASYVDANHLLQHVRESSEKRRTTAEMDQLKKLVREVMVDGALGLSSLIGDIPKNYINTEEIIELVAVVKQYGGIFATHIRCGGKSLRSAIKKVARVCKQVDIPVEITNLKFSDKKLFGRMEKVINMIDDYRDEGLLITLNQSPYAASQDETGLGILHNMSEEDVIFLLKVDWVSIGSNGKAVDPNGYFGKGKLHPQSYGTFPRVLGKFVREQAILDIETAVKKITWMNAKKIGIEDRGLIKVGKKADITIFDAKTIKEKATFDDPHQYSSGIQYVIVNGVLVIDHGKHLGSRPGEILFGKGRVN